MPGGVHRVPRAYLVTGRRPLPTALKRARGNPGGRPLNEHEPAGVPGLPDPPAHLTDVGLEAWRVVGARLEDMGVVQVQDAHALELFVDAWSEYREAREYLVANGLTYESATPTGMIRRPNPEVRIASDAWKRLKGILPEFGLTPSARSRLEVAPPAEVDPLEELLRGN